MMRKIITILILFYSTNVAYSQLMAVGPADSISYITSPLGIDSLFYWFDASQGVTDSLGGAIANNEGVGQWNDLSVHADHAKNSTDRPIYKTGGPGGRPYIVFDSSTATDQLTSTDSSYWSSDDFTIIAVGLFNSATADQYDYFIATEDKANFGLFGNVSAASYRISFAVTSNTAQTVDQFSATKSTAWELYSLTAQTASNTSSLYIDGSSSALFDNTTQTNTKNGYTNVLVGRRGVKIAEAMIFAKALTAAERGAIETYLNKKYDLY